MCTWHRKSVEKDCLPWNSCLFPSANTLGEWWFRGKDSSLANSLDWSILTCLDFLSPETKCAFIPLFINLLAGENKQFVKQYSQWQNHGPLMVLKSVSESVLFKSLWNSLKPIQAKFWLSYIFSFLRSHDSQTAPQ